MLSRLNPRRNILIIGGYNKAKSLALSLLKKGYGVTVVNKDYEACQKLAEIQRLNVIYGDGSKRFVLEDANVEQCEVAIALTRSDETNLVACELCKNEFGVKKTVSLLNDPSKTKFFYEMGIDSVVCAINMITSIMEEQALKDEFTKMIPIDEGRVRIVEVPILKGTSISGKRLWELNLPKEIIIGCIIRGDKSLVPRGDTRIVEGDILLIITSNADKLSEIKELTV